MSPRHDWWFDGRDRNVIGGSQFSAISLMAPSTTANRVVGNYVGVGIDGITPVPNGTDTSTDYYALTIQVGASHNTIGGDTVAERNVLRRQPLG